jgi:hypothetical protein
MKMTVLTFHRWPYGLELETSPNGLLPRARRKTRANWAIAFRCPSPSADELASTRQLSNKFAHQEWEW